MKNLFLKSITIAAFCMWIISACAIDSIGFFGNIALVAFIISTAWLVIFIWANNDILEDIADKKLK